MASFIKKCNWLVSSTLIKWNQETGTFFNLIAYLPIFSLEGNLDIVIAVIEVVILTSILLFYNPKKRYYLVVYPLTNSIPMIQKDLKKRTHWSGTIVDYSIIRSDTIDGYLVYYQLYSRFHLIGNNPIIDINSLWEYSTESKALKTMVPFISTESIKVIASNENTLNIVVSSIKLRKKIVSINI